MNSGHQKSNTEHMPQGRCSEVCSCESHKLVKFGRKLANFGHELADCARSPEDLCELAKFDRKLVNFSPKTCQLCPTRTCPGRARDGSAEN